MQKNCLRTSSRPSSIATPASAYGKPSLAWLADGVAPGDSPRHLEQQQSTIHREVIYAISCQEAPNIVYTNTLTENLADIQERDRYDVVLANPPFGGKAYQRPTSLKGDPRRNSQQHGCNL